MKLVCKEFKVRDFLTIIPLGDIHYGAKECSQSSLDAALDRIKSEKNVLVYGMGDYLNCGTKFSVGAGNYDDKKIPEEQFNDMIDMLMPIKNKIIGLHSGNHEERIRELTSFDLIKEMSKRLGVPYLGYSSLTKVRVNSFNYTIFSTHGNSSGSTPGGQITSMMKLQPIANADLYLMGHTHGLSTVSSTYLDVNFKNKSIDEKVRHFCLTGHHVDWNGSYGEKKNYPILKKGFPRIRLYGDRQDIFVSI